MINYNSVGCTLPKYWPKSPLYRTNTSSQKVDNIIKQNFRRDWSVMLTIKMLNGFHSNHACLKSINKINPQHVNQGIHEYVNTCWEYVQLEY